MSGGELLVYVSCAGSREIVTFAMDRASSALELRDRTPLPGTPSTNVHSDSGVIVPSYSVPLAVSPTGVFLYAVLRTPPFLVLSYRIERDGTLVLLAEASVPESTPYMHCDRSGRFLFGAAYQGDCVWVSAIEQGVAGPPHQVVDGIQAPHCVMPHHDNQVVYVAAAGGDQLLQFRFDAAARQLVHLGEPIRVQAGTRPRHLALHPRAKLLYCITEAGGAVDAYAIGPTGKLTPAPGLGDRSPPSPDSSHVIAADLHLTPDGRFLYGSERTCGTISAFAVAPATGALRYIESYPTQRVPRSFAIDPSGSFMLAAGQETGFLDVHRIDEKSGRLSLVLTCEVGKGPSWVEVINRPTSR